MDLTVTTNSPNSLTVDVDITEINLAGDAAQYREYSDGSTEYRSGVRAGIYVLDKALTPTGFDGAEGTDWENIEQSE